MRRRSPQRRAVGQLDLEVAEAAAHHALRASRAFGDFLVAELPEGFASALTRRSSLAFAEQTAREVTDQVPHPTAYMHAGLLLIIAVDGEHPMQAAGSISCRSTLLPHLDAVEEGLELLAFLVNPLAALWPAGASAQEHVTTALRSSGPAHTKTAKITLSRLQRCACCARGSQSTGRRRRTVLGKRSHGAAWKLFPGHRRT